MMRKTPSFWYDTESLPSRGISIALSSVSALYAMGHLAHQSIVRPRTAGIPVICIGNLTAGGSGKTPAALMTMNMIRAAFPQKKPCFLSRGYGGTIRGPIQVDPARHSAADVGDEPLLLARHAPAIIAADRVAGAAFAKKSGYDVVVMDDGLQNPSLRKNWSLIVIDGTSGFGNGLMLPAGPLRTPLSRGLRSADAVLLIGDDPHGILGKIPEALPVFRAALEAQPPANRFPRYVAFCGLAHPEKFRHSLEDFNLTLARFEAYPDHYPYDASDIEHLRALAKDHHARLITTEKDAMRLPPKLIDPADYDILPVSLRMDTQSAAQMERVLLSVIAP